MTIQICISLNTSIKTGIKTKVETKLQRNDLVHVFLFVYMTFNLSFHYCFSFHLWKKVKNHEKETRKFSIRKSCFELISFRFSNIFIWRDVYCCCRFHYEKSSNYSRQDTEIYHFTKRCLTSFPSFRNFKSLIFDFWWNCMLKEFQF